MSLSQKRLCPFPCNASIPLCMLTVVSGSGTCSGAGGIPGQLRVSRTGSPLQALLHFLAQCLSCVPMGENPNVSRTGTQAWRNATRD
jgi:hypothetical protein